MKRTIATENSNCHQLLTGLLVVTLITICSAGTTTDPSGTTTAGDPSMSNMTEPTAGNNTEYPEWNEEGNSTAPQTGSENTAAASEPQQGATVTASQQQGQGQTNGAEGASAPPQGQAPTQGQGPSGGSGTDSGGGEQPQVTTAGPGGEVTVTNNAQNSANNQQNSEPAGGGDSAQRTVDITPAPPTECIVCNGTEECGNIDDNSTTCVSPYGICYVLFDLGNRHVKMGCSSKEPTSIRCISEFSANIADGFCEYCCTTIKCNDDWTIARITDDCVEQSAAEATHHWPLLAVYLQLALHALLAR